MNLYNRMLREYALWREYRADRLRWWWRERRNPLRWKTFRLADEEYPYFLHPYNHTWANERAVEIPVVRRFLGSTAPSSILEVGNVLSHYFDWEHTVIDKYERCGYRSVFNEDLLTFNSKRRFDRVVSISTLEHIGWDEAPRNEKKVILAFDKIRSLLAIGGRALVTVPTGYNRFLDQRMHDLEKDGAELRCLKRISGDNQWVETELDEALRCSYGTPFMNANAVVFVYVNDATFSTRAQPEAPQRVPPGRSGS